MEKTLSAMIAISLVPAGATSAHTGVKDPQVKAGMENMKAIAAEAKTLGRLTRGTSERWTISAPRWGIGETCKSRHGRHCD